MPADTFQFKRGTTAAVNAYLPAVGEPVYDITLKQLRIGDGSTAGGVDPSLAHANLKALSMLSGVADRLPYFTGAGALSLAVLTAQARALLASMGSVATDLNTILDTSILGISSGTLNIPVGAASGSMVLTLVFNSSNAQQIVTSRTTDQVFFRRMSASLWQPWVPFVMAGANSTITSLTGLTTALSVAQGGTGVTTSTGSGSNVLSASPALTGTPTAPTAAVNTNTGQLATTAFVIGQAGDSNPIVDGVAAPGVSSRLSRVDHVHPSDTTKANLASPTFTGVPTAPTAAIGTNTTQLATMAAIISSILGTTSQSGGIPTGAAQEFTTGAGGHCWRFASGLQICSITAAAGATNNAAGALFTSTAAAIGSFTKNFSTAPIVVPIGTGSGGGGWGALYTSPTVSSWGSWAVYNHVTSASPATISLIAVGRWF